MSKQYLLLMLLLLPISVFALQGISGQPVTYFNAPACVGKLDAIVTSYTNVSYSLVNCSLINNTRWECPCTRNFSILTPVNTSSHYNIQVQYYIGKQQLVGNRTKPTQPTDAEIYNDNLKRIETISDIFIVPYLETIIVQDTTQTDIGDIVLFIFLLFLFIIMIVLVIAAVIYANSDRIKKRLGMVDERGRDNNITVKQIIKNIFSRPDVNRKQVVQPKRNIVQKTNKKESNSTQDEIRKLLEEFDK